ncbi:MAG: hypothetical protein B7Z20_02850 [Sphingobium sp. 32-64-5]|nr:MAG: hypothetical protein B7Z20_02850 [Sphingobium sp. 32-64-5]
MPGPRSGNEGNSAVNRGNLALVMIGLAGAAAAPAIAFAQEGIDLHSAVAGAILNDASKDRQADRDASRWPYASPGYGPISSAAQARDACAAEIMAEVGAGSAIIGTPSARTMSTGWEVEGHVRPTGDEAALPFVCSVRNGSVSGTLVQR